jgi:hypothetical protein
MPNVSDLRAKLAAYHRERGVRKCPESSFDQVCERRAIAMYSAAVNAAGSIRRAAALSECDRKTISDRIAGARGIYLKDALKLGRDGLYELATEITRMADEMPDSEAASG